MGPGLEVVVEGKVDLGYERGRDYNYLCQLRLGMLSDYQ